jgi:hypothetical protein
LSVVRRDEESHLGRVCIPHALGLGLGKTTWPNLVARFSSVLWNTLVLKTAPGEARRNHRIGSFRRKQLDQSFRTNRQIGSFHGARPNGATLGEI